MRTGILGLAACSNPRGSDGKTKLDQIIALNQETINKEQVNISEITDEDLKAEVESSESETVTIEPTSWSSSRREDGLTV